MSDVVSSGAVFIPAIMPTGLTFSQITPAIANDIASVLNQFTSQGVEVWLRFAHEVNYYVTQGSGPNGGPEYPGGSKHSPPNLIPILSPSSFPIFQPTFLTQFSYPKQQPKPST